MPKQDRKLMPNLSESDAQSHHNWIPKAFFITNLLLLKTSFYYNKNMFLEVQGVQIHVTSLQKQGDYEIRKNDAKNMKII